MDKRDSNREKLKKRPPQGSSAKRPHGKKPTRKIDPFAENKASRSESERESSSVLIGKKTFIRRLTSGAYVAVACVVVIAALTWAFTAFFTVSEIKVYGAGKLSAEEIIELSGIECGDSLVLINRKKIEKNLTENSAYIEGVSVRRLFPDTVELVVSDKTVFAAFETNGAYWLMSGNRSLLELALRCPDDVLVISGAKLVDSEVGSYFECEDEARQIILEKIFDAIDENSLKEHIEHIDLNQTYAVVLSYDGCFDIVLGNAENIGADCARINAVVEQARADGAIVGCIDMRDGNIRFTPERWKKNILD